MGVVILGSSSVGLSLALAATISEMEIDMLWSILEIEMENVIHLHRVDEQVKKKWREQTES